MTDEERAFIDQLATELPPVIAREKVPWFLGGIVSRAVLANEDSAGTGPKEAYKVGVKTVYPTRPLLEWIVAKRRVRRLGGIRTLDGALSALPAADPQAHQPPGGSRPATGGHSAASG